ncbi:type VII secretion protein [Mycobacteroides sp. H001]|uniref:type VII secretion integral membrane protein EccD n=1 Tax=Mycobacteroides TaxID=670516 RepID=UPI0007127FF8|nr:MULTISPECIES: type VII secretion integral membrane protein EccD [Mycobacteroides]KRQ27796.1 type VII secretion protein [Mycobacteroides sp. H072]KRQ41751.1 type VII secretion protein [Mycobacteroides sp. H002]KRQ53929.1 type VII secretion protein [Mycobacteroides sp. H054]KRQ71817.1 type VII secretion protein [Mycobacteroides sp. H001]OHU37038.1 type VII secretion integral membrane protein EccD [Mycobacteroides chelonae]
MNDLDESNSLRVISAEPEQIRVSVFGGNTQLDIGLPLDLPVSSFIPDLTKLVRSRDATPSDDSRGKEERRTFGVLSRFDTGVEIGPDKTLREAGVVNGELLRLSSQRALSPPTLYDDVVDAAAQLNKAAYAEWDSRSARWMGLVGANLGAIALALLLIQPLSQVQRVTMTGLGVIAVVGLTTFAAVARRSFALDDVAVALGAATIPISATLLGVPLIAFGGYGFAGACAALLLTNYVCYRAIGTGYWVFLASSLAAGLCGVAVLIHSIGVRTDIVCVVSAIVTILMCAAVPRLTAGIDHFEAPNSPVDVERSDDEWALENPFPTETPQVADTTNSGTNMPTAEQVWARVHQAALTRAALLLSFAGTAVAADTVLLRDRGVVTWQVFAFALTCAVALGLRSRHPRTWAERIALALPATSLAVITCVVSQHGILPLPLASTGVLLAVAVGAVLLGLTAQPAPTLSTGRTTLLGYLDYLAVGALIPVGLWALGLYEHLGPWW